MFRSALVCILMQLWTGTALIVTERGYLHKQPPFRLKAARLLPNFHCSQLDCCRAKCHRVLRERGRLQNTPCTPPPFRVYWRQEGKTSSTEMPA